MVPVAARDLVRLRRMRPRERVDLRRVEVAQLELSLDLAGDHVGRAGERLDPAHRADLASGLGSHHPVHHLDEPRGREQRVLPLSIGVVPAWLAKPSIVDSHHRIPTIPSTTPMSSSRRSSVPPCSMCSSRYAAMSPFARRRRQACAGSPPMKRDALANRLAARAHVSRSSARRARREGAAPDGPPSSFWKMTTSSGWRVTLLFARAFCATSIAASEPTGRRSCRLRGPSRCASRTSIGLRRRVAPARRPMMFPARRWYVEPRIAHQPVTYSRPACRIGVGDAATPPCGFFPNSASSTRDEGWFGSPFILRRLGARRGGAKAQRARRQERGA